MRALNICRLLSLAILLNHGEASDAAEKEGKEMDEHGRKLYFGWQYWDQHYQYNPYHHTARPTPRPTFVPTPFPTPRPTPLPTSKPTYSPTPYPSPRPTPHPTARPSPRPTKPPTGHPIPLPTRKPTPNPTPNPTPSPTIRPTPGPTRHPTYKPTKSPTERPTPVPTPFPTRSPTPVPTTLKPTNRPTPSPTGDEPSEEPTETSEPSEEPTETTEPSVTPTSFTSFSGSSTLSFESGCVGTNTLFDIICADFNANILGDLCTEITAAGLDTLLDDCNRRFTVFAPTNTAFNTFFNYFNDQFFSDDTNFPLAPLGDIVLDPADVTPTPGPVTRKLQVDDDFRAVVMNAVVSYHVVNGIVLVEDLSCLSSARFINMLSRGTTETYCDTLNGSIVGQTGTCNALDTRPALDQVNIQAANGFLHVVTNVMIPSPDGTILGCADIGEGGAGPGARAFFIADPHH